MDSQAPQLYKFDEYELDPSARMLRREGEPVVLTRRAFDLLLFFVQHPGQQLGKEELLKHIWPDAFVDENSLAKSISVLRKALDDTSERPYVVTLAGRGYQFARSVEIVRGRVENAPEVQAQKQSQSPTFEPVISALQAQSSDSADPIEATPGQSAVTATAANSSTGFDLRRALSALLLLTIVAGSIFFWWRHAHSTPKSVKVVVADLENHTGDKDFEYALKSAFQIDLEQTPFLDIVPRSAVSETLEEMKHKRDEPLTQTLASEVCIRNNAQVTLTGSISRIGEHYLLLVEATRCSDGKNLGGFKEQAASKSDVLHALDIVTSKMRQELGESRDSLGSYQTPIAEATTASLDALSDYSEAIDSEDRGDMNMAETLFERALDLDSNFASAYKELGFLYHNRGDFPRGTSYLEKAYDLRTHATARERMTIEIAYYNDGINDWEEAIVSMQIYNRIYPNDAAMWYTLSHTYLELGLATEALSAGEYAYKLAPHSGKGAEYLMRAYRRVGRSADAKRVANAAIADGKDRRGIHSVLYQIAFIEKDEAEMDRQSEWGLAHQQAAQALVELGFTSASEGKLREARIFFSRARQEALHNDDADYADDISMFLAGILIEYGDPTGAKAALNQMRSDAEDPPTTAYFRVLLGDISTAEHEIKFITNRNVKSTLNLYFDLPQLRAVLDDHNHGPAKAVEDLEPARKYQLRDIGVPYQRATYEAEAGMLEQSATDFRIILLNPGIDPIWPDFTLSHLRLARVLVRQQKLAEARSEYQAFLATWKDADADLPLYTAAKAEYAKIQ